MTEDRFTLPQNNICWPNCHQRFGTPAHNPPHPLSWPPARVAPVAAATTRPSSSAPLLNFACRRPLLFVSGAPDPIRLRRRGPHFSAVRLQPHPAVTRANTSRRPRCRLKRSKLSGIERLPEFFATGLGWDDVTQTVTADDAQWDAMIKVHKAIRAFRKGPPDNVQQLLLMFGGENVDGLSSVMPGVDDEEEVDEEEEEQAQGEPTAEAEQEVIELYDEENESPAPVQPKAKRKKASTIPCSPSKSKKTNVPKDFKRFVDHVIQEDRVGQTSKNTENDDILAIMEEVVKCEASETSDEYYIATKLSAKPSNCSFFYVMKTTEGRLNWLNRQFEDRKK